MISAFHIIVFALLFLPFLPLLTVFLVNTWKGLLAYFTFWGSVLTFLASIAHNESVVSGDTYQATYNFYVAVPFFVAFGFKYISLVSKTESIYEKPE